MQNPVDKKMTSKSVQKLLAYSFITDETLRNPLVLHEIFNNFLSQCCE